MRKCPIIVFVILFVSLWNCNLKSQTLTQSFLFDFGPNDVTNGDITSIPDANGNHWNNIYLSGIGNINSTNFPAITIKNTAGNVTTLGFSFVSGSFYLTGKQTTNGGLLNPVPSNFGTNADLAIATATEDYGFTSLTANGPVFKMTGLDQTKTYVFKIFASRSGTTTRTSQYTIQGAGTAVVGSLNSSTAGVGTNLGNVYVSSPVVPSTSGEISVTTISLVASNSAYINCMKLEEYNPIISLGSSENSSNLSLSSNTKVTVPAGNKLTIDNNTVVKSVVVNSGGQLTINSGQSLEVDSLILLSDINGTASFVDLNATNQLTVTEGTLVQQFLNGARNWYISSPVSNSPVPQSGYTFYSRSEPTASWITMNNDSVLKPGHGYIANLTSGTDTYNFSGSLNSGTLAVELSNTTGVDKAGFNLIGNPYPSSYTVTKSSTDAANALNTIWYRTATWDADLNKYVFTFQTCLINADGSTIGTPSNTTNIIPPMQAFWIRTSVNGSFYTFNNSQRLQQSSNLFKAPVKTANTNSIVRLQISNGKYSDETVLYANSNAVSTFDDYDALKLFNNNADVPEIYTLTSDNKKQLTINGVTDFVQNVEIPIGFRTLKAGTFTIKAIEIINSESDLKVFLKDNQDINNPVEVELTHDDSYDFNTAISADNTSRFSLIFKSTGISTGVNAKQDEIVKVFSAKNRIYINKLFPYPVLVSLYDISGRKINENRVVAKEYVLDDSYTSGIYFVEINDGQNVRTFKLIL